MKLAPRGKHRTASQPSGRLARHLQWLYLLVLSSILLGCGAAPNQNTLPLTGLEGQVLQLLGAGATPTPSTDRVLVGAGDIASCADQQMANAKATAKLLEQTPGVVFTLGDNVYDLRNGKEFVDCYQPSWGQVKDRTRPALGNHDYDSPDAKPYFAYFGAAAGDPSKGYYSYDLGAWHIVVLNSNCDQVDGCIDNTPQEEWLRADLASHPAACTLAMYHYPYFSSGADHGGNIGMQQFWQRLYEAHADVVLNGHEHLYERFAPQDTDGKPDPKGPREFIVGTGGSGLYAFSPHPLPTSEVRNNTTYGVLKLTLHANSYDWQFLPIAGQTFTDSGSAQCHGRS